jgi:acetoacetyl-CoA synthetase
MKDAPSEVVAGQVLWTASPQRREQAHLTAFRRGLEREWNVALPDYNALHAFSIDRVEDFWQSHWDYAGVIGDGDRSVVLRRGATFADDAWFPGVRINFAENMLRRRDEAAALVYRDETGARRALTFAQLAAEVAKLQAVFESWGVGQGDRVVGYLPNVPEAVVAMLAATSVGAIWAVVPPDLSATAAGERIGQLDPVVLVTADAARHGGRVFPLLDKAREVATGMPSLRATIVVANIEPAPDFARLPHAHDWTSLLAARIEAEPHFARLPFATPAFAMFTSGTTGKPKCLLHGGGGLVLQFAKEHLLHADIRRDDRVFRYTTTGWMMWNWSTAALAAGATVILYDGSPQHPNLGALFDLADAERLTFFSPSAALLDAYAKAGLVPMATHDLGSIRTMYSGGMRVPAANYAYVYSHIKRDVYFASPSGGTDPMAAFMAADPTGEVRAGEIPVTALGMKVELLAEDGSVLEHGPGELTCASPFPTVPLGLWGDADRARLNQAYFDRFPGRWCHGDWVERTARGGYVVHGRSDATLKVNGVRIGTAEIYRPLEAITEIVACAVVERDAGDRAQMVLLVQLRDGVVLTDALSQRIRRTLREHGSAHHVPAQIVAVTDLPRNNIGKVMEIAIRDAVNGRAPRNLGAIANPESLACLANLSNVAA